MVHRPVSVILPKHWRRGKAYHAYRAALAQPTTFRGIIEHLEAQLRTPVGRAYLASDFEPSARFAKRFVRSLALSTLQNPTLAKRAAKVLLQIFTHAQPQRGRKPVVQALTVGEAERIQAMRQTWATIVRPLWTALWPDRRQFLKALEGASTFSTFQWAEMHRSEMRDLLARPHVRPSHVVNQMTAWCLLLPVRRVRAGARVEDRDEVFSA